MNTSSDRFEPVFPDADFCSHMPFLRRETLLFCCAGEPQEHTFWHQGTVWQRVERDPRLRERFANVPRHQNMAFRRWKLWHAQWHSREKQRLQTGLPEEAVECVPSFYIEDGTYHVSFIGGIPTARCIEYALYEMTGPSLEELGPASVVVRGVRAGFISRRFLCAVSRNVIHLRDRESGKVTHLSCPRSARVMAVNCRADCDDTLIITSRPRGAPVATSIYRADREETYSIRNPNDSYKPSLYGNLMVCARRRKGKESYEICRGMFDVEQNLVDEIQRVASDSESTEILLAR